jgi:hypothetical protein
MSATNLHDLCCQAESDSTLQDYILVRNSKKCTAEAEPYLRLLRLLIRSTVGSAGIFAARGQTSSSPQSSRLALRHRRRSAIARPLSFC